MIVLDTSSLIAILFSEPDAEAHLSCAAEASPYPITSVVSVGEASIVASRVSDLLAGEGLDVLLSSLNIMAYPVDFEQMAIAREAFRKFGKGRGHPAQLNICDCFSYALATQMKLPLLFKGRDFLRTDVKRALDQ